MPWPCIPSRGKPEKKAVFSPYCGDKTTINNNKAFLFINRKLEQIRKIKTQPKNINQLLWQGAFSSPSLILKMPLVLLPYSSLPYVLGYSIGNVDALFFWLCHSMRLLHLHSAVKIQPFSPVFPLAGFTNKVFFRLSLWIFKEKASIIFL